MTVDDLEPLPNHHTFIVLLKKLTTFPFPTLEIHSSYADDLYKMLHSRNPSNPDGDEGNRDGQDAWSSAFPNRADQHFDCHSFGRMDRPVTPSPFASLPVGTESQASPSRLYDSFVAQSIRTDLLVLGENVLAPPPRHDASRGEHDATSPMRHEESHEMDEFNTPSQPKRLYRNVLPGEITPYLGLRSRLTQIPINRWTILLMLVLARLIILFESLNTNLASAQDEAASACSRVEEIGSAMASMPFYLSVGGESSLCSNASFSSTRTLV